MLLQVTLGLRQAWVILTNSMPISQKKLSHADLVTYNSKTWHWIQSNWKEKLSYDLKQNPGFRELFKLTSILLDTLPLRKALKFQIYNRKMQGSSANPKHSSHFFLLHHLIYLHFSPLPPHTLYSQEAKTRKCNFLTEKQTPASLLAAILPPTPFRKTLKFRLMLPPLPG